MIGDCGRDAHDTAVRLLRQHLLYDQLSDVDKAVQVGGGQCTKVLNRIVQKRLWKKYAGIIHQSIDRAESLNGGINNLLRGGRTADVTVDNRQMFCFLKLTFFADMTRRP